MTESIYSPNAPYELNPEFENLAGTTRYERALIILRGVNSIRKVSDNEWTVKSQESRSKYTVKRNEEGFTCNCPDCILHKNECKHILAVKMSLESMKPRVSHQTRDWSAYNTSLCDEFRMFSSYLKELISTIDIQEQPVRRGRKSLPIDEVIFAAVTKVAHQLSSRRGQGVVDAENIGKYNFTSTIKFLENPDNSALLRELLHASAKPFVEIEDSFSIDSSGFNTRRYESSWCEEKWNVKRERKFVKCHIVVGNKSNVVTDAVITRSNVADTKMFDELLNTTAGQFHIKQFLADAGYLSNKNYEAVAKINAEPLIMFTKKSGFKGKCVAWQNAYFKLAQQPDEFFADYNKRYNVESAFSAIKDKYGETLKSIEFTAQINELYCKLIAYNISVLVKMAHGVY